MRYRAGILSAFQVQNGRGGVNGRLLKLVSLDDAYEPEQAAANAERFVADNEVLAVIGGVGTPTAKRIAPVLRTAKIPFVGPFTGAAFLRDAKRFPNVINLRAGLLRRNSGNWSITSSASAARLGSALSIRRRLRTLRPEKLQDRAR